MIAQLSLTRVLRCVDPKHPDYSHDKPYGTSVQRRDILWEHCRRTSRVKAFGIRLASFPTDLTDQDQDQVSQWKRTQMPCIKIAPLLGQGRYGNPSAVILDLDGKAHLTPETVYSIKRHLDEAGLAYSIWESPTSRRFTDDIKLHILVPLTPGHVTEGDYKVACAALALALGIPLDSVDRKVCHVGQPVSIPLRGEPTEFEFWAEGDTFTVDPSEARQDPVVARFAPSREDRARGRVSVEDQGPVLRAFNEHASEGLSFLNQYSGVTGCVFEEDAQGWHWVAVEDSPHGLYSAGDSATPGHVRRTTGDEYRFSDFGNGPLTSRTGDATSLFLHEVLVRQAAWHQWGLESLDDPKWAEARDAFLTPVLFPGTAPTALSADDMFSAVQPVSGPAPSRRVPGALASAIWERTYLDEKGRRQWGAALSQRAGSEVAGCSEVLAGVVHDASGVVYQVQEDGSLRPLAGKSDEDALFAAVRDEAFDGATVAPPFVRWVEGEPQEERVRAAEALPGDMVRQMVQSWVASPDSLVEPPKQRFLRRCRDTWVASGRPEPRDLFNGVVPGMARQDDFAWAQWLRLWLTAAEVGLHPGTEWVKTLPFLAGGSNAGKSQLVEALAGVHVEGAPGSLYRLKDEEFFVGSEGSRGSAILDCSQALVVELGEMQASLAQGDVSRRMKAFVTQSEYSVVPKFMGGVVLPRSFMVVVTANNGHNGGLIPADEGSARRYMVLEMVSKEDAARDPGAAVAYQELSRLVSPSAVESGEAGRLEALLLGWAADQVLSAEDEGCLFDLLDGPFRPDGEWYDESVRSQSRYLSGQSLRQALLTCQKGVSRDGWYYLSLEAVRESAGLERRITGTKLHELEAHARALGGSLMAAGRMVRVPVSARESGEDADILALLAEVEAAGQRI